VSEHLRKLRLALFTRRHLCVCLYHLRSLGVSICTFVLVKQVNKHIMRRQLCVCLSHLRTTHTLILLHVCSHTTTYVSLPLPSALHTYPHTTTYMSSYCYICVLILHVSSYCYMCPHTAIDVSSYCFIYVLILLHMCPHTTTYVS
jgi:hypothetical protein